MNGNEKNMSTIRSIMTTGLLAGTMCYAKASDDHGQGYLDLTYVKWDRHRLTGKARVVAGEPFRIVIALNGRQPGNLKPSEDGRLAVPTLQQVTNQTVEWRVNFRDKKNPNQTKESNK